MRPRPPIPGVAGRKGLLLRAVHTRKWHWQCQQPPFRCTQRLRKPLPSREKRPALSGGVLAAAIYRGVAGLKAEVAMKSQAARARPPIWHPLPPAELTHDG
jgi:hypothetical protein